MGHEGEGKDGGETQVSKDALPDLPGHTATLRAPPPDHTETAAPAPPPRDRSAPTRRSPTGRAAARGGPRRLPAGSAMTPPRARPASSPPRRRNVHILVTVGPQATQ